jgi:hypothetical protein
MAKGRRPGRTRSGHRSAFEDAVAADLAARGVDYRYEEEQLLFEMPCSYTYDFKLPNGVIIEAKGYFDADDRRKMREVKRAHPHRDIRLLFMRAATRISKAPRAMTYGEWATRNGFCWAEGRVPDTWLES